MEREKLKAKIDRYWKLRKKYDVSMIRHAFEYYEEFKGLPYNKGKTVTLDSLVVYSAMRDYELKLDFS